MIAREAEEGHLTETEIRDVIVEAFDAQDVGGKRVLVVIPDGTRTAPIPLLFRLLYDALGERAKQLDILIALGTHPPMTEMAISRLLGVTAEERAARYPKTRVYNHHWNSPDALTTIGVIPAPDVISLTDGLMREEIPVAVNEMIFGYDLVVICGPVFPHEVAGFSGGNKYFFPGIAGPDMINRMHWLGALVTSTAIMGHQDNPVRRIINRAAEFIAVPKACCAFVTRDEGLAGLYFGTPEEAQAAAAELSGRVHVEYVEHPFQRVLAVVPPMYEDLWTAAKGIYKTEPIVADGGEVVLYAPHLSEVSFTHGAILDEIGYHVLDYFVSDWDRFKGYPWGLLAHSPNVRGRGTMEGGVERPRIQVTLATCIPEDRCRRLNLDYLDPAMIRLEDWEGRESEGILLVRHAGEKLYRLKM